MKDLFEQLHDKKLVIFDLDGTIGNLAVDWPAARNVFRQFIEHEFKIAVAEGLTVEEMERLLVAQFGKEALQKTMPLRWKFESSSIKESRVDSPVVVTIRQLYSKDVKLAICSNNMHETIVDFLEHAGIAHCFEYIVGIDDFFLPKPDSAGCQKILEHFPVAPSEAAFVGDNPHTDGAVAQELGIPYINV